MDKTLTLSVLQSAVTDTAAAFRSRTMLQPAGGEGTKVFPPTYSGAVYATEKRRLPGHEKPVECVLLDSVQSQANRMEEALQQAIDSGRFKQAGVTLPLIEVDFTPYWDPEKKKAELSDDRRLLDPVGKVSSLQAPHRIADAILRDSLLDGKPFRQSDVGERISRVQARDATALFEFCPTALLFGMWDSTGPKGGLGAKFERALVSEIVGVNAVYGVKTSSRIDPLGIRSAIEVWEDESGNWTLQNTGRKYGRNRETQGKPSAINHGNFPPSFTKYQKGAEGRDPLRPASVELDYRVQTDDEVLRGASHFRSLEIEARQGAIAPGGVTIASAEQTVVMSLAALRRLRFPIDGNFDPRVDDAARTALAALGLCAATLAAETGLDLRSRCLLWPTEPLRWELLCKPGEAPTELGLTAEAAIQLLKEAVAAASKAGLPWREKPLVLTPSDQLVKLVVKSQQLAVAQGGGNGEGGD